MSSRRALHASTFLSIRCYIRIATYIFPAKDYTTHELNRERGEDEETTATCQRRWPSSGANRDDVGQLSPTERHAQWLSSQRWRAVSSAKRGGEGRRGERGGRRGGASGATYRAAVACLRAPSFAIFSLSELALAISGESLPL